MPTIAEAQQRHAELMAAGKIAPEPAPAELQPQNASIPPKPEGTGVNGPSRGGYLPGQIMDFDVRAYGPLGGNGPMRSRVFPFLPPAGNNNVAAQNAVKAEVAASKSAVSTAVANLNNTPVATVQSGQLTQTTIGKIPPLPAPPAPRFIPIDQVTDGLSFVKLTSTHAAANVAYNFRGAWSATVSYVISDEVTYDNIYWIALVNNLNSQPAIGNSNWQAVGRIQGDIQIFTSSGVWSKPASGSFAIITVLGGGAGGVSGLGGNTGAPSAGGTGGPAGNFGGFSTQILPLSVLGTTETVTVGTGGASDANGLTSSFGGWLQATGGASGGVAGEGTVAAGGISMLPGAGGTGNNGGGVSGGGGTSSGGNGAAGTSGATGRPTPYSGGSAGTGGAGGTTGTNGNNGGNGTAASTDEPAGGGGGGGAGGGGSSSTGVAGNGGVGGNGGKYGSGGGGGGGGGASDTGTPGNGGAGGIGAPGIVIVVTY